MWGFKISNSYLFTHPNLELTDRCRHQSERDQNTTITTEKCQFKKVPSICYPKWLLCPEFTSEVDTQGNTSLPHGDMVLKNLHYGRDENECSLLAGRSHRAGLEPNILSFFWTYLLVESLLFSRGGINKGIEKGQSVILAGILSFPVDHNMKMLLLPGLGTSISRFF